MRRPASTVKRYFSRCLGFGRVLTLAGVIVLAAGPAPAEIFRYVDVDGVIHYTDNIDKVPERYKDGVQQQKSVARSKPADEDIPPKQPTVINSDTDDSVPARRGDEESLSAEDAADRGEEVASEKEAPTAPDGGEDVTSGKEPPPASDDAAVEKHNLEKERRELLERKNAMANDKTYQKRKTKRRYKNRPTMQKLLKEEARIDTRLEEIEKALQ